MLHFNPIHFYIKQTNKHWNDLKHMCGEAFAVMGAALRWNSLYYPVPQWWAGMWQAASSYGVEPESLSSALPQSPGSDPFSLSPLYPPHCQSHHTPPSSPFLYPSLIWTIRAKTGEASFLRTHPTSSLSFSVIYFPTPSLHSSISLPLHADNQSGLVVDGGVNSALWWCLKGSGSIWLSSGWLTPCLLVMEPF